MDAISWFFLGLAAGMAVATIAAVTIFTAVIGITKDSSDDTE